MAKRLAFREFNVTGMSKEHLTKIFCITKGDFGWSEEIENLEMVIIEDKIIVRGWATRRTWERFYERVINDFTLDYLFVEWEPKKWGF